METCFLHASTYLCRYLAWRFTLFNFTFAIMRTITELVVLGILFLGGDAFLGHSLSYFRLLLCINQIILICWLSRLYQTHPSIIDQMSSILTDTTTIIHVLFLLSAVRLVIYINVHRLRTSDYECLKEIWFGKCQ